MRNQCARPLAVIGWLVCACAGGHAQTRDTGIPDEIREGLERMDRSTRLRMDPAGEVAANPNGDEFFDLQSRIKGMSIPAPEPRVARPVSGQISLRELQHPPSKNAIRAIMAASRLSESAQYQKAAQKLEEAIRESPDFAAAHSNLAAQKLRMGFYEEGLEECDRALRIAGPNQIDLTNRGFALFGLGRNREAEEVLRAAIRMNAANPRPHIVLGQVLAARPETRAEALMHLDRAADEIPAARPLADQVRAALAARR